MLDFVKIRIGEGPKKNYKTIYPDFEFTSKTKDLMIRGGAFYAVWDEEAGRWSEDFYRLIDLIDSEVNRVAGEMAEKDGTFDLIPKFMRFESSGILYKFVKFTKSAPDRWKPLNQKPIFKSDPVKRRDYSSKRLEYDIDPEEYNIEKYDDMMAILYSPEERQKIEWAVGCCLCGEVSKVQKFVAFYGGPGTGKSTVLNIIEELLKGYTAPFDAASLGNKKDQFSLESFTSDPIVAIQHDADMSRITDNTRFNSVVSHEVMLANEKFRHPYKKAFNVFIFIGTNTPIKITDARSGIGRRLIDISPTGNLLQRDEYDQAKESVKYALGGIAHRCITVYKKLGPYFYDSYRPTKMYGLTNDVYSFLEDNYFLLQKKDEIQLSQIWDMYKQWSDDSNVPNKLKRKDLQTEIQYYYREYLPDGRDAEGNHVRNLYRGFKSVLFTNGESEETEITIPNFLKLSRMNSNFDSIFADMPAQYASIEDKPIRKWSDVDTALKDIDTSKVHFVRVPKNHIVIDFDLKDDFGKKSLELNLEAARLWPPTYAETSKSGNGLHLHYIYTGDVSKLSSVYDDGIEVKIFRGNASLRRKLSLCNGYKFAEIGSGLPLKEDEDGMVSDKVIKSERSLRKLILRNLNKEIHGNTTQSMNFIKQILDDAYSSGLSYDVHDMYTAILSFAMNSTHQSDYCMSLIPKLKLMSDDRVSSEDGELSDDIRDGVDKPIAFFDVEVFPNLFILCWKKQGENIPVISMINPTPDEVLDFVTSYRIIGYNNRRYDNHILHGAMEGYTNIMLYKLSDKLINGKDGEFLQAYNYSYTDVLDFMSEKKSLKKCEIELGIDHKELGLPWDKEVPEDRWYEVAEYCKNDVIATEKVYDARQADFTSRKMLADVSGMTVNTSTNSLTNRIIFGGNKHPQDAFNYRFLGSKVDDGFTWEDYESNDGQVSGVPYFPGYIYDSTAAKDQRSWYRGEYVKEGGYVYAEPGMYYNVALLDISSMHPSSIIAENLFGDEYTNRFKDIRDARIAIKHGEYKKARKMLGGKLAKYLDDETQSKALANALKIAINSVYGLTSAGFDNPCRDPRNKDNIVAKRGALFMVDLKNAVQKRGFTVAHIKTDSIKIPNATPEIIDFIIKMGKAYGYNFEHEATYERMCLINDAVYIARYSDGPHELKLNTGEKLMTQWYPKGTQFAVPYVFKKLFSGDKIIFEDLCETKSVKDALYLDMNENLPDGDHNYIFVGKVGRFSPIKEGCGGGKLVVLRTNKYDSASGAKNYRWLESETVKVLGKENDIDLEYYEKLCRDAIKTISKFGNFEEFIAV